jgi:hypothetical protein
MCWAHFSHTLSFAWQEHQQRCLLLDCVQVKGRLGPVRIYTMLPSQDFFVFPLPRSGPSTREQKLAQLSRRFSCDALCAPAGSSGRPVVNAANMFSPNSLPCSTATSPPLSLHAAECSDCRLESNLVTPGHRFSVAEVTDAALGEEEDNPLTPLIASKAFSSQPQQTTAASRYIAVATPDSGPPPNRCVPASTTHADSHSKPRAAHVFTSTTAAQLVFAGVSPSSAQKPLERHEEGPASDAFVSGPSVETASPLHATSLRVCKRSLIALFGQEVALDESMSVERPASSAGEVTSALMETLFSPPSELPASPAAASPAPSVRPSMVLPATAVADIRAHRARSGRASLPSSEATSSVPLSLDAEAAAPRPRLSSACDVRDSIARQHTSLTPNSSATPDGRRHTRQSTELSAFLQDSPARHREVCDPDAIEEEQAAQLNTFESTFDVGLFGRATLLYLEGRFHDAQALFAATHSALGAYFADRCQRCSRKQAQWPGYYTWSTK